MFKMRLPNACLRRAFSSSIRPEFDGTASLLTLNTGANAMGTNNVEELINNSENNSEYFVGRIPLIGICDDNNSTYMSGPQTAPNLIRKAFLCSSTSFEQYFHNDNKFINTETAFIDCGNLQCNNTTATNHENICSLIENIYNINAIANRKEGYMPHPILILGGDHAITYPVLLGCKYSEPFAIQSSMSDGTGGKIAVIHFDAHPDLYPTDLPFPDNQYSHASPFYNLLESDTIDQILQIGIRCMTKSQQVTVEKHNDKIQQLFMDELFGFGIDYYQQISEATNKWICKCREQGICSFYISIDIDVLDPSFAPGVSHVEPFGLSSKELFIGLDIIMKQLYNDKTNMLIGCDIVEYNPLTDYHYMTAFVAGKLMRRIAANAIHLSD